MKRILKEIQVVTTEFRKDVIQSIFNAYPDRVYDDEDPSNDIFFIDDVPVRIEADRIVVGDDLDNYIPLKDAPMAGQPPRYRDVDSILADFDAYINKEKRENSDMLQTIVVENKVRIPNTNILLEENDRILYRKPMKEATELFKKSFLKKPGDFWRSKDKNWGVWWSTDEKDVLWIYEASEDGEDYYEVESLEYDDVESILFRTNDYAVKVKESTIADIEKLLKKTGWDIEETDDDFLLAQYGDEIFSINADSGEVNIGTDEGSEVIWTGSYDDFTKTYKGVKDNMIIVDNKSFKAVTESTNRKEEAFSGEVSALMRALDREGWDVDSSYEYDATFRMGNIFVTVHDDGKVIARDAYDAKGFLISTNVKNFARDYGKIIDKFLKPKYDYGDYKRRAPEHLLLI